MIVALMAAGCSVILSTAEPTQCSTTADCDANPSLRGRVCTEGYCTIPSLKPPFDTPDSSTAGCVSSTLCTQANSGQASHCAKAGGSCTPWQTSQCKFLSGKEEWKAENALVIGSIQPFTVKQVNGQRLTIAYADRIRRASISVPTRSMPRCRPASFSARAPPDPLPSSTAIQGSNLPVP
jgi:hypothetical protein